MLKKAASSLFLAALAIFLFIGPIYALPTSAQNAEDALKGLNNTAGQVGAFKDQLNEDFGTSFIATRTGQIIGLVLSFIGIIFFGLIIYAGLKWMTAGGNEQTIAASKDMLINATIGIVIVFAAYAITVFLGNQFI